MKEKLAFSGDGLQNGTHPSVDWESTGRKLRSLRLHDQNLRKAVCSILRNGGNCCKDCVACDELRMDHTVTQSELAKVMNVSPNVIHNWEAGRSEPHIEYLLWYGDLAGCDIYSILVFKRAPINANSRL